MLDVGLGGWEEEKGRGRRAKVVNIMQKRGRRRTEERRRKMGGGARQRGGIGWREDENKNIQWYRA